MLGLHIHGVPSIGAMEWGAEGPRRCLCHLLSPGSPWDLTWDVPSSVLYCTPLLFPPDLGKGLHGGVGNFWRLESQTAPVSRVVEGRPWGAVRALWCPLLSGVAGCSLLKHLKKNRCGPSKRDFFLN